MVGSYDGRHLSERHANEQATPVRKRKASEISHDEKENEPSQRPKTPPTPEEYPHKAARNETTPGRVGPIKKEDFSLKPDIKPFKGPPGHKVRKTRQEKNEEYRQFAREHEDHIFHELYVCFDKGPSGSPTYDKQGFELDYWKVADWMGANLRRKPNFDRMMAHFDAEKTDERRMAEIFFEEGSAPEDTTYVDHWRDRVSKDLRVPWHKVWVKEFEEWERRGFPKAKKGEWQHFLEQERKRVMDLHKGVNLRK